LIKPPYGAVEIDWAHPLAWGLTGYWLFNEGAPTATTNLVVPQVFSVVGTLGTPIYGSRGPNFAAVCL
jgi:hypothetical protein